MSGTWDVQNCPGTEGPGSGDAHRYNLGCPKTLGQIGHHAPGNGGAHRPCQGQLWTSKVVPGTDGAQLL